MVQLAIILIKPFLVTAIVTMLSVSQATAAITQQLVWNSMRDFYTSIGFEISSTEAHMGKELRLRDVMLSKVLTKESHGLSGTINVSLSSLKFTKINDKTISIILPNLIPMRLELEQEDGLSLDLQVDYLQNSATIEVSSSQYQQLTYTYTADSSYLELKNLMMNDINTSNLGLKAHLKANDPYVTVTLQDYPHLKLSHLLSIKKLTYAIELLLPALPDSVFSFSGNLADLTFDSDTTLTTISKWSDLLIHSTPEAHFRSRWSHGNANIKFLSKENGKNGSYHAGSFESTGNLTLSKENFDYNSESSGKNISLSHEDLPFPITLDLANLSTRMMMPFAIDTALKDFKLGLDISKLSLSPVLWSAFDTEDILPKDPLSFNLGLSGNAKGFGNVFTSNILGHLGNPKTMLKKVQNIELEKLHISGIGTAVSALGSFKFDNADLITFRGMPRPIGHLEVELDGGYALLDRLVEMGLIPKTQSMGVRMMLSMFTVPGTKDDKVITLLEITPDGYVLANGQRIR